MSKSGFARLIILILFFLFMILYSMELTGYNEYNQNRKNMLTTKEVESFENDIKNGKDVSVEDYLKERNKNYNNKVSKAGLSISKGIGSIFNSGMNSLFKMLEEAVNTK